MQPTAGEREATPRLRTALQGLGNEGPAASPQPQAVTGILLSEEMRYEGSVPFQAFLQSSQGGGGIRAPELEDQRE